MLEVMKKQQEKRPARNNRIISKDEEVDEEPHFTTRRGKMPRLDEKDHEQDVMDVDEENEEEKVTKDRKRKRGPKEPKSEVPSVPDVNETFTVPTPAMMEVINKKNERKAAASKAKK
uniref:Uncharacterized protein n=1 Tax=Cacopsylla melanoneura TaxID=428564 RepID=A0A8D8PX87_9HEMI